MNPWTALLESLHSALIDEVIERHPEPKPTLGMPLRLSSFGKPAPEAAHLHVFEIGFDSAGTRGLAAIAADPGFPGALGCPIDALWAAILGRAEREFERRGIRPRVGSRLENAPAVQRVIWIPVALPGGRCWLGVGV